MADWMTMLEMANTALCSPAGRPMRRIIHRLRPSMRSLRGSRRMSLPERSRRRNSRAELKALAMTVAMATPLTVIWSTATKNRFSSTFSTPDIASATSGTRVSPTLRKIAASKL